MIEKPKRNIDYLKASLEALSEIDKGSRPSILLHACCGPCSTYPLLFLCPHFDVTIYFNNSNIYPSEEYERRLEELKKFLVCFEKDYGFHVDLIVRPYDNLGFMEDLKPYASQREGGERCQLCYTKRMGEAFDYAESNGFDYFTTVMTISRQKNSQILNLIGEELSKKHCKTRYFHSDFKKGKGIDKAREMRMHYGLYNQLYCGCVYSFQKAAEKDPDSVSHNGHLN